MKMCDLLFFILFFTRIDTMHFIFKGIVSQSQNFSKIWRFLVDNLHLDIKFVIEDTVIILLLVSLASCQHFVHLYPS